MIHRTQQKYNIITEVTETLHKYGVYGSLSYPLITVEKGLSINIIQGKNNSFQNVQPILNNLKDKFPEQISIDIHQTVKDIASYKLIFEKEKVVFNLINPNLQQYNVID